MLSFDLAFLELNPLPTAINLLPFLSIEEAKEYYKKVTKINPNFAEAYNNLGIIFGEFKEFEILSN